MVILMNKQTGSAFAILLLTLPVIALDFLEDYQSSQIKKMYNTSEYRQQVQEMVVQQANDLVGTVDVSGFECALEPDIQDFSGKNYFKAICLAPYENKNFDYKMLCAVEVSKEHGVSKDVQCVFPSIVSVEEEGDSEGNSSFVEGFGS